MHAAQPGSPRTTRSRSWPRAKAARGMWRPAAACSAVQGWLDTGDKPRYDNQSVVGVTVGRSLRRAMNVIDRTLGSAKPLTLYGVEVHSRLLLGTARYPSPQVMSDAVKASRVGIITVSVRREQARGNTG